MFSLGYFPFIYLCCRLLGNFCKANDDSIQDYLDTDVHFHTLQVEGLNQDASSGIRYQVKSDSKYYWPDGLVYYAFSPNFTVCEKTMMRDAMAEIEQETCIQFIDWDDLDSQTQNVKTFINITREGGCQGRVGYWDTARSWTNNDNWINFSPTCFVGLAKLQHEILHALGIEHTQNRVDRDEYVKINRQNIEKSKFHNFQIRKDTTTFNLPYDYNSVMHYKPTAFAIAKENASMDIYKFPKACVGQRLTLSNCDLEQVRIMYNCTRKNDCEDFCLFHPRLGSCDYAYPYPD